MLIEGYGLEVFASPCEPGTERFSARTRLVTDISQVLPYLKTTLRRDMLCGVTTFVVAGPKDVTMYQDAVNTTGHEGRVIVKDLIKLVHEAL